MATCGRKKRNLLPFSAFQDDESKCDQKNNLSGELNDSTYFGAKLVTVKAYEVIKGMKIGTKENKWASQEVDGTNGISWWSSR